MKIILITLLIIVFYLIKYYSESKRENFNIYCNKKNEDKYDFFSKRTIIDKHLKKINSDKTPNYIYTSESLIPYNYSDKLDNNIVYNLNIKKKDKIHRLEKLNYGGIMPKNSKLLLKNYNKNLDQLLVDNETPIKYRVNSCYKIPPFEGSVCSIKNIEINLLGRYKKNKLHINWDLPVNCIDIKEFYLFYKRKKNNDKDYKSIKIEYNNKSDSKIFDFGKLNIYKDFSNIKYNFFFKKPTTYNCFIYVEYGKKKAFSNIF